MKRHVGRGLREALAPCGAAGDDAAGRLRGGVQAAGRCART